MSRLIRLFLLAAVIASPPAMAADVTVSAAASLRDAFTDVAAAFRKAHPEHRVLLNTGASGQLLQQISRGAPVDVFASADQATMDKAARAGLLVAGTRVDFARNGLVVAVSADASAVPSKLADLESPDVHRIAIGNPAYVPAGEYAKLALEAAGLWEALRPKYVNTQNVRQALDYVARGETDAGFVYRTDALLMASRVKVAFEVPTPKPIVYPVALVKGGGHEKVGRLFLQFVRTPEAQKILAKYGFASP
ncbi:MAG: molybdate ABC transporter substrate-binding protein [Betaproteobacteria bacterium]|nr:molybdate ABC transporter substrate-binding protein [Betaproteobacteria bacterium]